MPASLDALVDELIDCDREDRLRLLVDMARTLPPLPERLARYKDREHRVPECVSNAFLFVERDGDRVAIFADVPVEAPSVRGFVAMLVEALNGAPAEEILAVPDDLIERSGMPEILGMQRVSGLHGVLRRLKGMVARLATAEAVN